MSNRPLALITAAACLSIAQSASAQAQASGPMTSEEAAAAPSSGTVITTTANSPPSDLLYDHNVSYSVGWRFWVMAIPQPIVSLFVHIEPGWGGGTNIATGPEFVYRKDNLDIAIGAMYVGYGAAPGFFHGTNEGPDATEQITSNLFGLYLTSHFLWGIRLHRMFEIQVGVGIGIGYIGGELLRSQAYPGGPGGAYTDCVHAGADGSGFCGSDNAHYSGNTNPSNGGGPHGYAEPGIFSGGSVPTLIPWVSIPQIGLHFRPHRNFDVRADGGFAVIGFYGGLSAHYVF